MKRTTHAFIGATTIGLVVPVMVSGLASTATAARTSYTQQADMTILDPRQHGYGDGLVVPSVGDATPYPSTIEMEAPFSITDVNVRIDGINHDNAADLDILLVGPGGQQATILSDVGGDNPLVHTRIGFDDEADTALSTEPIAPGISYQPTNLEGADEFSAPAPSATGASALSVFDGTSARGTWSLYVVDDAGELTPAEQSIGSWHLIFEGINVDPYPSTITVADALPVVADVDVTLHGLSHTYPGDLDVVLVGPSGRAVTLASDSGGSGDVNDLTLTFDDEADAPLPAQWTEGSFKPTNEGSEGDLPAPGPQGARPAALSDFDGTDANGDWRLFVHDNAGGDIGTLSGWSLNIDAIDPTAPTGTVSINGGAATSSSTGVTLNVDATDPAPASGVKQMRFSNDGTTWSAWQAHARTAAWELTSGDGVKTVWAQFVDAGGNVSEKASDTITLDTTVVPTDTTAPGMKKAKPVAGATDVNPDAKLKVKSTERLLRSTLTKKSVVLKKKGTDKTVKGEIGYRPLRKRIAFKPKNQLESLTKYVLIVKTTVTDRAGNRFDADPKKAGAQPLRIKFTTR